MQSPTQRDFSVGGSCDMAEHGTAHETSRRALLAGAAGGAAALGAEAMMRAGEARGADGDPVLLGRTNTASSTTTIEKTSGTVGGAVVGHQTR
jgi:hypothetical protein